MIPKVIVQNGFKVFVRPNGFSSAVKDRSGNRVYACDCEVSSDTNIDDGFIEPTDIDFSKEMGWQR